MLCHCFLTYSEGEESYLAGVFLFPRVGCVCVVNSVIYRVLCRLYKNIGHIGHIGYVSHIKQYK